MKQRSTLTPVSRDRFSSGVGDTREYLERLARILVHCGQSPKKLQREFTAICSELKEPTEQWDASRLNYVSDLPHVITHWQADPQYLDPRGAPLALPLTGRGPSVSSLIRRVLPHVKVNDVIQSLIELKGIRRRGELYAPTEKYLSYHHQRVSALAHGLTALMGMLRTLEHNVASRRDDTLFEKAAINPRFPVAELSSFHRRLKNRADGFLWSIDADMRRREERHTAGRGVRLGVGIFAFEEPNIVRAKRSRKARSADRPKTRRA